jgi:hypothetical protein
VDAAVQYCGIVKFGTDMCGGITLDLAAPCRKPELYIPDAVPSGGGAVLKVCGRLMEAVTGPRGK